MNRATALVLSTLCSSILFAQVPSMVRVDGGTFTAGSTPVSVSSFSIDKYEVTYELWTDIRNWGLTRGYTDLPPGTNGSNPIGSNNPVSEITWHDAVKWCNARSEKEGLAPAYYTNGTQSTVYRTGLTNINNDAVQWKSKGYRLPTEAEWEFAARGGAKTLGYMYSGSNNPDSVAWYGSNSASSTHTVGQKTANELGLYDMTGNVFEWSWDWYGSAYPSGGTTDPRGPSTTQTYRSLRGGGFGSAQIYCRVSERTNLNPNYKGPTNGFRCVAGEGVSSAGKHGGERPLAFTLRQNYPNPFNPNTTISYELPRAGNVSLKITNTLGQVISTLEDGYKEAGFHQLRWNASNVPSGIYFYRLQAGEFVETKKMVLLR